MPSSPGGTWTTAPGCGRCLRMRTLTLCISWYKLISPINLRCLHLFSQPMFFCSLRYCGALLHLLAHFCNLFSTWNLTGLWVHAKSLIWCSLTPRSLFEPELVLVDHLQAVPKLISTVRSEEWGGISDVASHDTSEEKTFLFSWTTFLVSSLFAWFPCILGRNVDAISKTLDTAYVNPCVLMRMHMIQTKWFHFSSCSDVEVYSIHHLLMSALCISAVCVCRIVPL